MLNCWNRRSRKMPRSGGYALSAQATSHALEGDGAWSCPGNYLATARLRSFACFVARAVVRTGPYGPGGERGSVSGVQFFPLVEHPHKIAGRLFIQPGGHGGGPEPIAAESTAQHSERLDVFGRGGTDLEPDGKGTHPVGDRLVKVPGRLTPAAQDGVTGGDARLITDPLINLQGLAIEEFGGVIVS
jgi:hypothetical protein